MKPSSMTAETPLLPYYFITSEIHHQGNLHFAILFTFQTAPLSFPLRRDDKEKGKDFQEKRAPRVLGFVSGFQSDTISTPERRRKIVPFLVFISPSPSTARLSPM